jgi:RHH-type proline utilization regulon transcriptional repressor/proline dehydrogenase/delta 1-pyrroline-5-carboxylate dehydrogenase
VRAALLPAASSDARWWRVELGAEHDPTGLFCEANVLRYRPLPLAVVRVAAGSDPIDVARVLLAVTCTGAPLRLSVDPSWPGDLGGVDHVREAATAFGSWAAAEAPARIRLLGDEPRPPVPVATFVDDRPVVHDARVELLRYVREQAVSRTLHRFGNLVDRGRG